MPRGHAHCHTQWPERCPCARVQTRLFTPAFARSFALHQATCLSCDGPCESLEVRPGHAPRKSRPPDHGTVTQPHHAPRAQRHELESTRGLFIWQSIAASLKRITETRPTKMSLKKQELALHRAVNLGLFGDCRQAPVTGQEAHASRLHFPAGPPSA